ncbi:MAG: hypothetical protein QOF75_1922 [Gaiellaceae bacterium]|jgi:uncharacterized protein YukE|nr:hypothetical protein [Gaiellaceae bacterium]MDX6471340.1 hypothetical protein [Gaiellaceae bacterium]
MASNRSRAHQRSTALAAPADTLSQALKALGRRAARIQIACCGAAAMTFTREAVTALPRAAADLADTRAARAWTNN